jgi:hypothetical protein
MRSRWLLPIAFLVSAPLLADAAAPQVGRDYTGTFKLEGAKIHATWSAWVDADLATVSRALRDWKAADKLMPRDPVTFEVRRSDANSARLYVEQKSIAFFLPNPTLLFDASYSEHADGTKKVAWQLVEGLPKAFDKRWTLRSEGAGTRVDVKTMIQMPFKPPEFVAKKSPAVQIPTEVARFVRAVGATGAWAKAPATTSPPVVAPPATLGATP